MPIIEVDGLVKTFRTRERDAGLAGSLRSFVAPRYRERQAVKRISFCLEPGEVLAFFLGNTEGLAQQLLGTLITFSTYPMNIFSGTVRLLLFTVIPAGFISFVPLQLLHQFSWPLLAALFGFTTLIVFVAMGVFHLGLRRYESGNLLGMQG